jgi:hypothetical protein
MGYKVHVRMRIEQVDRISELLVGVADPTYEFSIALERILLPAELHQLRLDLDKAYLPAHTKVDDIWQGPPPQSAEPVVRRWNLNEAEGKYAGTNIVESIMELHLGLKCLDGQQQAIGRFRLDLNALADKGFVTRRVVEGNRVFDVQIYREPDSAYSLGVRRDHTTPLAPYAVP